MATAVLNWSRKTVPEKIIKANFYISQVEINVASFPTPNPSIADLQTATDGLSLAAVQAMTGAHLLVYAKNVAEKTLDDAIKSLQAYVQNVSNGDGGIILQSGMEVKKSPSSLPDPEQVENLNGDPTKKHGEVQLTWDTLENVIGYQVEQWIADDKGDGFWDKIAISTKSKFLVTGLTTGTVYKFRVSGIGKDDVLGAFSQEASSIAA
jgi:hypothetical protein